MPDCLELPRPWELLRTTGWNLAESFGLPLASYVLAAWLRKLVTGSVPSLLMISMIVLTVQAVVAVATGNLWIFLVHFPLANLGLCIVFARTARGRSPLAAQLADEVIGLRCSENHQPSSA